MAEICTAEHCNDPASSKTDYCPRHLRRIKDGVPLDKPWPKRFEDQFVAGNIEDCWEWKGRFSTSNYGLAGKFYAHRVAYERAKGQIPDGLHIDHLCRNTHCVNPAHLEAVTPRQNAVRGFSPRIVGYREGHCIYGHPHTDEDYFTPAGHRQCEQCRRRRENARVSCPTCGLELYRVNLRGHARRHDQSEAA